MTMPAYPGDVTRALKWQQNNAPNITSLITQKAAWYSTYAKSFWTNWETNVLNLETANNFGLAIWCIILGVPPDIFGLHGTKYAWGFDSANTSGSGWTWRHRQNFVNSAGTPPTGANLVGGNFIGAGPNTILNPNEVRALLRMRFYTLISNGTIEFINKALVDVWSQFASGGVYNYPSKNYFVCVDESYTDTKAGGAVSSNLYMEYRIGSGLGLSSQTLNILDPTQNIDPNTGTSKYYGMFLPSLAGVKYRTVVM